MRSVTRPGHDRNAGAPTPPDRQDLPQKRGGRQQHALGPKPMNQRGYPTPETSERVQLSSPGARPHRGPPAARRSSGRAGGRQVAPHHNRGFARPAGRGGCGSAVRSRHVLVKRYRGACVPIGEFGGRLSRHATTRCCRTTTSSVSSPRSVSRGTDALPEKSKDASTSCSTPRRRSRQPVGVKLLDFVYRFCKLKLSFGAKPLRPRVAAMVRPIRRRRTTRHPAQPRERPSHYSRG